MSASKTDRELLELAAKAAGFTDFEYCELSGDEGYLYIRTAKEGSYVWSSLADDGDALRLLVEIGRRHPMAACLSISEKSVACEFLYEGGDDLNAATRRAITRAAARIGEAMP